MDCPGIEMAEIQKEKDIHVRGVCPFLVYALCKIIERCKWGVITKESDHLIEHNHIRYVIFDFADTKFCDSSGIGVIMGRYRKIYMLGGEVCAVHTSERIRKILTMSGVTKIMQIYEEEK